MSWVPPSVRRGLAVSSRLAVQSVQIRPLSSVELTVSWRSTRTVACDKDRNLVLASDFGPYVLFGSISSHTPKKVIPLPALPHAIALSRSGRFFACWFSRGNMLLLYSTSWDVEPIELKRPPSSSCGGIAISNDEKTIVAGSNEDLCVWDISTQTLRHTLKGHKSSVGEVLITPDNHSIISTSSDDRTISLWSVETGALLKTLHGACYHMALSMDGTLLIATGVSSPQMQVWDLRTGANTRNLNSDVKYSVTNLTLTPDGYAVVACQPITHEFGAWGFHIWDLASGACKHLRVISDARRTSRLEMSADGKYLLSFDMQDFTFGNDLHTVSVWHWPTIVEVMPCLCSCITHSSPLTCVIRCFASLTTSRLHTMRVQPWSFHAKTLRRAWSDYSFLSMHTSNSVCRPFLCLRQNKKCKPKKMCSLSHIQLMMRQSQRNERMRQQRLGCYRD